MTKTKVAMKASEIRKELKAAFPTVKFSVRSSSYSMGSSIRIEWTDLPSVEAVEAIADKYSSVRRCEVTGEILSGGNTYINCEQEFTPEFEALVESQMEEHEKDSNYRRRSAMNRIMNKMWEEQNGTKQLEQIEVNQEMKNDNVTNEATLTINEDKNGIEISFTSKPSLNIIGALKENGFKWSSFGSKWWAKNTPDRLRFATMVVGAFNSIMQEEPMTDDDSTTDVAESQPEAGTAQVDITANEELYKVDPIIINGKVKVKNITFEWSESNVIEDNATFNTFKEAEDKIRLVASKVECGYDKTKFIITWTDGETYTGRIDVEKEHETLQTPIKDHITNWLLFLTGDKKPSHMTDKQYEAHIIKDEEERQQIYGFLRDYALIDTEPNDDNSETTNKQHDNVIYHNFNNSTQEEEQPAMNATASAFDDILSKFDNVKVTADSKISADDLEFCQEQEYIYQQSIQAYNNLSEQLQAVKTAAAEHGKKFGRTNGAYFHGQSTALDASFSVYELQRNIDEITKRFISGIAHYFMKKYNITIDYEKIQKKYKSNATYENIVDEIMLQLDGFNFNEKAEKEIKEKTKQIARNSDRIAIKNNKLIIDAWFSRHDSIWKEYRINGEKCKEMFEALQHFDNGSIKGNQELNNKYVGYENERNTMNFERYEPTTLSVVKSIKILKNGKMEIEFNSNQQVTKFAREYCDYKQQSA